MICLLPELSTKHTTMLQTGAQRSGVKRGLCGSWTGHTTGSQWQHELMSKTPQKQMKLHETIKFTVSRTQTWCCALTGETGPPITCWGEDTNKLQQDIRQGVFVGVLVLFCNFRYSLNSPLSFIRPAIQKSLDHTTNQGYLFSNTNYVSKALWMCRHRRARKNPKCFAGVQLNYFQKLWVLYN